MASGQLVFQLQELRMYYLQGNDFRLVSEAEEIIDGRLQSVKLRIKNGRCESLYGGKSRYKR